MKILAQFTVTLFIHRIGKIDNKNNKQYNQGKCFIVREYIVIIATKV